MDDEKQNWSMLNIDYHNQIRKDNMNRKPFIMNEELTEKAFQTAKKLADESCLYHFDVPVNGTQNVGQGYKNWIEKPRKCVDIWFMDDLHRFPILSDRYQQIGVGYHLDQKTNKVYVVANYIE